MKSDDLDKESVKMAIEAEVKKAELARPCAEFAVASAKANLEHAEARRRGVETMLGADTPASALGGADAIASGLCGRDFRPNPGLRLELVQGLKADDSSRLMSPPIYD